MSAENFEDDGNSSNVVSRDDPMSINDDNDTLSNPSETISAGSDTLTAGSMETESVNCDHDSFHH